MTTLSSRRTPSTPDGRLYDDDTHTCMALRASRKPKTSSTRRPISQSLCECVCPKQSIHGRREWGSERIFPAGIVRGGSRQRTPSTQRSKANTKKPKHSTLNQKPSTSLHKWPPKGCARMYLSSPCRNVVASQMNAPRPHAMPLPLLRCRLLRVAARLAPARESPSPPTTTSHSVPTHLLPSAQTPPAYDVR